jgi:very-short-patch-repair endonuclease
MPTKSDKTKKTSSADVQVQGLGYVGSGSVPLPLTKASQYVGGNVSTIFTQPMFFSPLHTPQSWQIASRRKEVYQWARFYYENEPKAAAGIDFYATFPMNGFKLECRDRKVLNYFEHQIDKLNLDYWFRKISHEYFLLGDVFVFLEIDCPVCHGATQLPDGRVCNHPNGCFKRLMILNPDFVEVQNTQLAEHPTIAMLPDDDLRRIVQQKRPREVYEKISPHIRDMVAAGQPIPLSPRCVSHLRHKGSPYGTYGESLLRRLFMTIAYKTKLMTANWIMAERHILPIRIVKVGTAERPANEMDIADVQSQLSAVANDPNLTIVTHHAFEMTWEGATGKIHDISNQMEYVGKEMLDGLMLNQTLLNGEMQAYSGAAVGVETLIRRLETWRMELARWAEHNIFLPLAQMQGFVDTAKSKQLGETVWLYPRIKWNDLRLRDNSEYLNKIIQLYDKQVVSRQKLLDEFDIDFDVEVSRIREEQVMAGAGGQVMGGGGPPMGGDMGGGSPLGGGMPPPMGGGMSPLPDLGGGLGGDPMAGAAPPLGGDPMGGGLPGGGLGAPAPPAPGGMGASASLMPGKIFKRGKGPKAKDMPKPPQPKQIFLTKPEQKLASVLNTLAIPYPLFAQFQQYVPGQRQPFLLDFAYPQIGVDVEADGEFWHSDPEAVERDRTRDMKLAQMGWRVIRIKEEALNSKIDEVSQVVMSNIREAIEERRILSKFSASLDDGEPRFISTEVADIYIPSRGDGEGGGHQNT